MNDNIKFLKEFSFFKNDIHKNLDSKIPVINYSIFENIFSHLLISNSYSSLDNLHQNLLCQDDYNYLKKKITLLQNQIYIKTIAAFCLGNLAINYLIFNPVQGFFLSTARSFKIYKRFKLVLIPFISTFISLEMSKGISIDLNSYIPCSHPYYNLVYFDAYFKRDLLDINNINTLDFKKLSELANYSSNASSNKKEIENILLFFVIKYNYLLLLVGRRIIQMDSPSIVKPFINHFYDSNYLKMMFDFQEIYILKKIVDQDTPIKVDIPKVLDEKNIKKYLDIDHVMEIIYSYSKLRFLFKFVKEYKDLKKEKRLIDDDKISNEIEQILTEKIDNISRLINHDINTSLIYKKFKIKI